MCYPGRRKSSKVNQQPGATERSTERVTSFTCLHLGFVSLLGIKPKTFSWTCPAGSPCPLLGRSFADGRDQQRLHPDTWIVNLKTKIEDGLKSKIPELDMYHNTQKQSTTSCLPTFCLANPGSMTNTTPSIVNEVSAMFVETTT